ncbi:MAG: D-aminoacylase [Cytophagales bacterium]|nr:D-aminoacylase [Cytophagales bacterium]
MISRSTLALGLLALVFSSTAQPYDRILRGGTIYNGDGKAPFKADIGIRADTIAFIGDLTSATAKEIMDITGLAVAPGFINMLSWADGTLLKDGRSMSDIKQGVTLEVFGEGISPGPRKSKRGGAPWTTLGGYFNYLEKQGVSTNFASFVGATTIRTYVMGDANRPPTKAEMEQMKGQVRKAMQQGAMGVGSSLIYTPATYARTEELIELCKTAGEMGGMYITHLRSEGDEILKAIDETLRIAKEAKVPAEIYHLKINHQRNWDKIDKVLFKIDSANRVGLKISANMYPYIASATGLKERVPTWAQEGGMVLMRKRFKDPVTRKRILSDMEKGIPSKNSLPKNVVLLGFRKDSLAALYKGKHLDEVAKLHGKNADETVLDLLTADRSSIAALYFLMSEETMRRFLVQPYVSIGSDGGSLAVTPEFQDQGTHPRAYGTFARVLGEYVREEKLFPLEEAIRRMTTLPASHLGLKKRGALKTGHFADVVIFDPATIADRATFENPHQYAVGVKHVLVNGQVVLRNGEHTGAKPGRVVRCPTP